jgi:hypothetical protein
MYFRCLNIRFGRNQQLLLSGKEDDVLFDLSGMFTASLRSTCSEICFISIEMKKSCR